MIFKVPSWFPTLDFGAVLLLYSNAAINPIIYGGLNESFRRGFKDLMHCIINRNTGTMSDPENVSEFRRVYARDSTLTIRNSMITNPLEVKRNGRMNAEVNWSGTEPNKHTKHTCVSTIQEGCEDTTL